LKDEDVMSTFRQNKFLRSLTVTIFILTILLFPMSASAITVSIEGLQGRTITQGESLSFYINIGIEGGEAVPISKVRVTVRGPTSFAYDFSPTGGTERFLELEAAQSIVDQYAYGYGFAYGYVPFYGYGYGFFPEMLPYGYGYGFYPYGYGYGFYGPQTLRWTATLLNTGNLPEGQYRLTAEVFSNGVAWGGGPTETTFTVVSPIVPIPPVPTPTDVEAMPIERAVETIAALTPTQAADILKQVSLEKATEILQRTTLEQTVSILEELPLDRAVAVLERVTLEQAVNILEKVSLERTVNVMEQLGADRAVQIAEEMKTEKLAQVLNVASLGRTVEIVEGVSVQKATDTVLALTTERAANVLENVRVERAKNIVETAVAAGKTDSVAKVIVSMKDREAATVVVEVEPARAASVIEVMIELNRRDTARTVEHMVDINIQKTVTILERLGAVDLVDLLLEITGLPSTPQTAAKILEVMSLEKSIEISRLLVELEEYDNLGKIFQYLSTTRLNEIFKGLTLDQRVVLYPYLTTETIAKISTQLLPLPDLAPISLETTPKEPVAEEEATVKVTVKNIGNVKAGRFKVELKINGATILTLFTDGLDVNASAAANFSWKPMKPGSYVITTTVDPEGTVKELNEANNVLSRTVTVKPKPLPDLTVQFSDLPKAFEAEQEYTLKILVKNIGNADATKFSVELKADGATIGKTSVDKLAAGGSTTLSFKWKPEKAADYTLKATADPEGLITESDETNNAATVKITVAPAPIPWYIQWWPLIAGIVILIVVVAYMAIRRKK